MSLLLKVIAKCNHVEVAFGTCQFFTLQKPLLLDIKFVAVKLYEVQKNIKAFIAPTFETLLLTKVVLKLCQMAEQVSAFISLARMIY